MRVHGRANRAPASIAPSASQDAWQELLYCSAQGLGYRSSGVSAGQRRPNESFKPKPLRYAVQAAVKACHLARSTTRLSLTLVLGLMTNRIASITRTALYLVAVALMIHSAGVIMDSYSHLYELASTGSSAYGKSISDLPRSLTPYVLCFIGALAIGGIGDFIHRRYGAPKGTGHAA